MFALLYEMIEHKVFEKKKISIFLGFNLWIVAKYSCYSWQKNKLK